MNQFLTTGKEPAPRYPALRKAASWLVAFLLAPWLVYAFLIYLDWVACIVGWLK